VRGILLGACWTALLLEFAPAQGETLLVVPRQPCHACAPQADTAVQQ